MRIWYSCICKLQDTVDWPYKWNKKTRYAHKRKEIGCFASITKWVKCDPQMAFFWQLEALKGTRNRFPSKYSFIFRYKLLVGLPTAHDPLFIRNYGCSPRLALITECHHLVTLTSVHRRAQCRAESVVKQTLLSFEIHTEMLDSVLSLALKWLAMTIESHHIRCINKSNII